MRFCRSCQGNCSEMYVNARSHNRQFPEGVLKRNFDQAPSITTLCSDTLPLFSASSCPEVKSCQSKIVLKDCFDFIALGKTSSFAHLFGMIIQIRHFRCLQLKGENKHPFCHVLSSKSQKFHDFFPCVSYIFCYCEINLVIRDGAIFDFSEGYKGSNISFFGHKNASLYKSKFGIRPQKNGSPLKPTEP